MSDVETAAFAPSSIEFETQTLSEARLDNPNGNTVGITFREAGSERHRNRLSDASAEKVRIESTVVPVDETDDITSSALAIESEVETIPLAPAHSVPSSAVSASAACAPEDAHFVAHLRSDPYLVLHRSIYFWGMGANAAYSPFAVQLWSSPDGAGLDLAQCGAVYAAGHVAAMFAAPLLSSLADRSEGWRRTVLVTGFVAQACAVLLMSRAHTFLQVALTQVLVEAVGSGVWTGVDAATQRLLEVTKGSTAEYGNTRAFGALGWGACAWAYGAAFDVWGIRLAFVFFAATSIPAAVLALWLPVERRAASSEGRIAALRALVRRDVAVVLTVVLISAMLLQTVDVYRFPFLRSIGASNTLLGASLTMTAVSEAPFFFVTSAILARVSLRFALAFVLGTYALRFMFYSALGEPPLEDPSWTLPAELLHGFTFALGWAAATQYVAALLPPELSASAQGLLGALQWGLGSAAGSASSGAIARTYGWRTMWRSGAALAAGGTVLMLACGARTSAVAAEYELQVRTSGAEADRVQEGESEFELEEEDRALAPTGDGEESVHVTTNVQGSRPAGDSAAINA